MTVQQETSDLERQIQDLASNIHMEIEDKISSFVVSYIKNKEFSNDEIEQHKHYQLLKSMYEQLQTTLDTTQESNIEAQTKLQKTITLINKSLLVSDEKFKNLEQLNTAKLTNSEQVLKEKSNELSTLSEQLKMSTATEEQSKKSLVVAEENTKALTQKIESLEESAANLAKNDKAKSATLTVQNQQVSALTLQLNNVVSELDYIKAEHNQKLTSQQQDQQNQQLLDSQQAVVHLKNENIKLNDALKNTYDVSLLEIGNEKKKYKALQGSHKAEVEQLKSSITEHKVALSHTVKSEEELQEKRITEKKQVEENIAQARHKIVFLEGELSKNAVFIDESNKKYQNDTNELQQKINDQQARLSKQEEELVLSTKQLTLLQQNKDELSIALKKAQTLNLTLENKMDQLKSEVNALKGNASNIQQRIDNSREKQELEYTKARETIKHLRDENAELTTQLEQQVSELEDKLREYRLRFEYAQKQLNNH